MKLIMKLRSKVIFRDTKMLKLLIALTLLASIAAAAIGTYELLVDKNKFEDQMKRCYFYTILTI